MKALDILNFLKLLKENREKIEQCVNNMHSGFIVEGLDFDVRASVCGLVWNNLSYSHEINETYFKSWKHYSNEESFPVSGENVYYSLDNFWEGDQGWLRFDLIDHLISCYEKDLKTLENDYAF